MKDHLLMPHEVAAIFGVHPKTIARWANHGRLDPVRTLGGHRRYWLSEVERMVNDRTLAMREDRQANSVVLAGGDPDQGRISDAAWETWQRANIIRPGDDGWEQNSPEGGGAVGSFLAGIALVLLAIFLIGVCYGAGSTPPAPASYPTIEQPTPRPDVARRVYPPQPLP